MSFLMTKISSIVRRENSIMLYLNRPLGYTISPMSLYEVMYEDKKLAAPVANGNTVKAFKLIIKKNKQNYWVNNLNERCVLKINSVPLTRPVDFNPTEQSVFFGVNHGLATFLSYFTEPEFVIPKRFILQVQSLNDCYDTHILFNLFQEDNIRIYITGKVSKTERGYIESNEKFKKIIKFGSAVKDLNSEDHVYISTDDRFILKQMQENNISYTNIPASL